MLRLSKRALTHSRNWRANALMTACPERVTDLRERRNKLSTSYRQREVSPIIPEFGRCQTYAWHCASGLSRARYHPLRSSATGPHPSPPPLRQGREHLNSVTVYRISLPCRSGEAGVGAGGRRAKGTRPLIVLRDADIPEIFRCAFRYIRSPRSNRHDYNRYCRFVR